MKNNFNFKEPLHIFFNEDTEDDTKDKDGKKIASFSELLLKFESVQKLVLEYSLEKFLLLLNIFSDDLEIYVWIHPNIKRSMKDSEHSYPSVIIADTLKSQHPEIEFNLISRHPAGAPKEITDHYKVYPITVLNKLTENKLQPQRIGTIKGKVKSAIEIIDLKNISGENSKTNSTKKKLSDELSLNDVTTDIGKFKDEILKFETTTGNTIGLYEDFNSFIEFLKNGAKANWLDSLCKKTEHDYSNIKNFDNNYWGFTSDFFDTYFPSQTTNKYVIEKDPKKKNVHYDNSTKQWHINIRLFRSFFKKYPIDFSIIIAETQIDNDSAKAEKIKQQNFLQVKRLMRLFLLHESLHKVHNIDEHSVFGIGNFPRIVEEADYQADAFVIISEFFFWYSQNKSTVAAKEIIIKEFEEIIYVALNTTLSFAGTSILPNMQVRRFNRYTIWLYILALLNKLRTNSNISNPSEVISAALDIFANKPILDIYGLNIELVEDDSDFNKNSKGLPPQHVCFILEEVNTSKLDAAYFFENKVKRTGATTEKFNELIDGLRNSKLNGLIEFVNSLESII